MTDATDFSIIAVDKFIQATRDSGYRGTDSAIAELVDNALQAGAKNVSIEIAVMDNEPDYPLRISVLDDGCGMDRKVLRQALRFGGSTRFNDRHGLGRFGMGLPNSSLSQARHVDVYTWRKPRSIIRSFLDVDQIATGKIVEVPDPVPAQLPNWAGKAKSDTGTLIVWTRCDRLDNRRAGTIAKRLFKPLGRMFRYHLWNGVTVTVNGTKVEPIDPLYLHNKSSLRGAQVFGDPIEYTVQAPATNGDVPQAGKVTVTFSELPVQQWHALSNEEKRKLGVANGAGVSVVRANREIDYGWFFLGGKRRENYDDWWRAEVRFEPSLDEAFGITHTKQQIRPQDYLLEVLGPDMESIAKALNSRVRQVHFQVRATDRTIEVEQLATKRENLLKPLPKSSGSTSQQTVLKQLIKRNPSLKEEVDAATTSAGVQYRILHEEIKDTAFFEFIVKEGLFLLVLNAAHPFYRKIYKPLIESDEKEFRSQLDLMLLSCARAEAAASRGAQKELLAQCRKTWSDNLATFLNG